MTNDRQANSRIRLLVLGFAALFAVALGRAAWIQVVDGSAYAAMASKQQRETIEIPAGRGTIYDRTGEPLAIGELATTVYADPRHVVSPRRAAVNAGETLGVDPNAVFPGLSDRTKQFVYVERKADPVKAKALQRLGIPGIGFYPEERRTYPQGRVAAQLLGFAGTDNQGLDGLERSLDKKLAGRPGYETSSATRRVRRSTSSPPARSGRERTSCSRSTISCRRPPSSCSPRRFGAGTRRARRRS